MPRKLIQCPAAREAIRHCQARQLAAEQLALNVAGEIPAIAGLPSPGLADQWREEFGTDHGNRLGNCW